MPMYNEGQCDMCGKASIRLLAIYLTHDPTTTRMVGLKCCEECRKTFEAFRKEPEQCLTTRSSTTWTLKN